MILDYITPNGNYDGLFSSGGLRIYHVDATLANEQNTVPPICLLITTVLSNDSNQ